MKTALPLSLTLLGSCLSLLNACLPARAGDANPAWPVIVINRTTNGQPRLVFPYPAAGRYEVLSAPDPRGPLVPDPSSGVLLGPSFSVTNRDPAWFYRVRVTPLAPEELLAATVLNRLCYGPSPADIDHIRAVGAEAYIQEQLAGEMLPDTLNVDPSITNTPLPLTPPDSLTNWIRISATGRSANTTFGAYLTGAGSVYLDDIRLVYGTNADSGTNLLLNGDFENPVLSPPWSLGNSIARAVITNSPTIDGLAASGTNCLWLTARAAATQLNAGFFQLFTTSAPSSTQLFTLSFSYLPVQNTNPLALVVRLTGGISGVATGLVSLPLLPPAPPTPPPAPPSIAAAYSRLTNVTATLDDLRAWHVFRAIHKAATARGAGPVLPKPFHHPVSEDRGLLRQQLQRRGLHQQRLAAQPGAGPPLARA